MDAADWPPEPGSHQANVAAYYNNDVRRGLACTSPTNNSAIVGSDANRQSRASSTSHAASGSVGLGPKAACVASEPSARRESNSEEFYSCQGSDLQGGSVKSSTNSVDAGNGDSGLCRRDVAGQQSKGSASDTRFVNTQEAAEEEENPSRGEAPVDKGPRSRHNGQVCTGVDAEEGGVGGTLECAASPPRDRTSAALVCLATVTGAASGDTMAAASGGNDGAALPRKRSVPVEHEPPELPQSAPVLFRRETPSNLGKELEAQASSNETEEMMGGAGIGVRESRPRDAAACVDDGNDVEEEVEVEVEVRRLGRPQHHCCDSQQYLDTSLLIVLDRCRARRFTLLSPLLTHYNYPDRGYLWSRYHIPGVCESRSRKLRRPHAEVFARP